MKQAGPLPKTIELAKTLARRVSQLRELRNMTKRDLAKSTKFGIRRIEDIEGGLETWLSATDRQLLAKALSIEPALIEEVENRYDHPGNIIHQPLPETIKMDLTRAVIEGVRHLTCPTCGHELKCSIQQGFDLDGLPVKLARAYCIKCPFVLR